VFAISKESLLVAQTGVTERLAWVDRIETGSMGTRTDRQRGGSVDGDEWGIGGDEAESVVTKGDRW